MKQIKKSTWNPKGLLILELFCSTIGAILAGIILLLTLAAPGANLSFSFAGVGGYEATGVIGVILGVGIGSLAGLFFLKKWWPQNVSIKFASIGATLGVVFNLIFTNIYGANNIFLVIFTNVIMVIFGFNFNNK